MVVGDGTGDLFVGMVAISIAMASGGRMANGSHLVGYMAVIFAGIAAFSGVVTVIMAFVNRNHIQEIHVVKDKLETLIRNGNNHD